MIDRSLILIGLSLAVLGLVVDFHSAMAENCSLQRQYNSTICCRTNVECPLCTGTTSYEGAFTRYSGNTVTQISKDPGNERVVSSTGITCWQSGSCRAGTGGFGTCCDYSIGCFDSAWGVFPCVWWCYLTQANIILTHPETTYSMDVCGGG